MGEITPKNEGNAGSHGGWLVIYYFKLFQVSNHHRDHVPLYRIFRLKRKDDQPSLPIIRCWWVVICWFKYYFKLVGGFKPFETYQIGSFPHERLKTKNWNHHPATFKVWQQFRKESPASQTHRVFGWKTRIWAVHDVAVNFGGISINGRQGEVLWLCCLVAFLNWFPFQKKLNEARKSSVI